MKNISQFFPLLAFIALTLSCSKPEDDPCLDGGKLGTISFDTESRNFMPNSNDEVLIYINDQQDTIILSKDGDFNSFARIETHLCLSIGGTGGRSPYYSIENMRIVYESVKSELEISLSLDLMVEYNYMEPHEFYDILRVGSSAKIKSEVIGGTNNSVYGGFSMLLSNKGFGDPDITLSPPRYFEEVNLLGETFTDVYSDYGDNYFLYFKPNIGVIAFSMQDEIYLLSE